MCLARTAFDLSAPFDQRSAHGRHQNNLPAPSKADTSRARRLVGQVVLVDSRGALHRRQGKIPAHNWVGKCPPSMAFDWFGQGGQQNDRAWHRRNWTAAQGVGRSLGGTAAGRIAREAKYSIQSLHQCKHQRSPISNSDCTFPHRRVVASFGLERRHNDQVVLHRTMFGRCQVGRYRPDKGSERFDPSS